jgi:predicted N-acetyltransferase YhbS
MHEDIVIRPADPGDLPAISALHARIFGPGRFARTAYRVREGTEPISPHCLVLTRGGVLAASLRFTRITIGGEGGALLLGPLAVETSGARTGLGTRLVAEALSLAKASGGRLVVLVGDLSYYGRLGFARVPPGQIEFPGPVDPTRILAIELVDGALGTYAGMLKADRTK